MIFPYNPPMKFWLKTAGLIAAVWLVAVIVIHFARASQPTADTVIAYVSATNLAGLSSDARAHAIQRMEDMMNRITIDDRGRLDRTASYHDFFNALTPAEQDSYLDATLPTGFQQLMESFNKMDPLKRKQFVNDALARMKEQEDNGPIPGVDSHIAQRIIDNGLKAFYSTADADVKLDLSPLIEQMQRNLEHQ